MITMKALITATIEKTIPFFDLDPMSVCWHGNYVKYFEEARCALLQKLEYDYPQMNESGYFWPIIDLQIRYIKTISYGQVINITAGLIEYENYMRIDYEVHDAVSGGRLTKGMTKQVAVGRDNHEMQYVSPEVFVSKVKKHL